MQKRNPEQDKWITHTELPYYRLLLDNPPAASHIAVLLADGNTHGNKYVVRREDSSQGKTWIIPNKHEKCIYPRLVYRIMEVAIQTPIPDIPWHLIDSLYKHAAMEMNGTIWFYEETPKFNDTTGTWQITGGDFVRSAFLSSPASVVAEYSLTSRPE